MTIKHRDYDSELDILINLCRDHNALLDPSIVLLSAKDQQTIPALTWIVENSQNEEKMNADS